MMYAGFLSGCFFCLVFMAPMSQVNSGASFGGTLGICLTLTLVGWMFRVWGADS